MREYTPRVVAQICGISRGRLVDRGALVRAAARRCRCTARASINRRRARRRTRRSINLHLATGQIGKPGAGPFSLTGQPNAMGGREVGGLANLARPRIATSPIPRIAPRSPRCGASTDVPAQARAHRGRAVRRAAPPARSRWSGSRARIPRSRCPTRRRCARRSRAPSSSCCRRRTPTPRLRAFADVLLPASTLGREGRHGHQLRAPHLARARGAARRRARRAPTGRSRSTSRGASKRACGPACRRCFPTTSAAAGLRRARARPRAGATSTSPGLSLREARARRPAAVAVSAKATTQGRARLYTDRRFATADGRARFAAVKYAPVAERVDARYPFRLNTGRLRDQWHGMSRTGTLADAVRARARAGGRAEPGRPRAARPCRRRPRARRVAARQRRRAGRRAPRRGRPGSAYLPMHWGSAHARGPRQRRRQRGHGEGLLPGVEAARAQARRGAHREGRAAVAPARVRLSASDARARRVARRAARAGGRARVRERRADRRRARRRRSCARASGARRRRSVVAAIDARSASMPTTSLRYDDPKRAHRPPRSPRRRTAARGALVGRCRGRGLAARVAGRAART